MTYKSKRKLYVFRLCLNTGVFVYYFSIGFLQQLFMVQGSESLNSVFTLPSLAGSRSVRFETGTRCAASTMSAKEIAKAKLEVKALMDSKPLYAGGIPYM